MKLKENVNKIITHSLEIGNEFYDKFKKTKKVKYGRNAIRAYNTSLRAMIKLDSL